MSQFKKLLLDQKTCISLATLTATGHSRCFTNELPSKCDTIMMQEMSAILRKGSGNSVYILIFLRDVRDKHWPRWQGHHTQAWDVPQAIQHVSS